MENKNPITDPVQDPVVQNAHPTQAEQKEVQVLAAAAEEVIEGLMSPLPEWMQTRIFAFIIYLISRVNDQLPKLLLTPFIRLTPKLFVGPQLSKRGWLELRNKYAVTGIVNLRVEADDRERGINPDHYLWIPTIDHTSPTVEQLYNAATFIRDHIKRGEGVYIHCAAGVGRAPLTVASYLVLMGYEPDAALRLIKTRRPFISQSSSQRNRLLQFADYVKKMKQEDAAQAKSSPANNMAMG